LKINPILIAKYTKRIAEMIDPMKITLIEVKLRVIVVFPFSMKN